MKLPILIPIPGNEAMAQSLVRSLGAELGHVEIRAFPDGETYLRLLSDVTGRNIAIVCTLDRPDHKILPLLFLAATARELGATKVGLMAPYLAYMRQDRRFKSGEAVTSREIARLISNSFDWLVTIDPHLHRYGSLSELYRISTCVIHAAPLISKWIKTHIQNPIIIGPDSESDQWVSVVAREIDAPYTVLQKVRRGDRDVEISIRDSDRLSGRSPVFVDDIISTGHTMVEALRLMRARDAAGAICIAVHGIFADNSDALLKENGARVVTTNSIPHPTNAIDVTSALVPTIREYLTTQI